MSFTETCSKIELILSDVDGVMTDGGIRLLDDGRQMIVFHIRDGMGVRLWREAGKKFGIVTGREVPAVRRRAEDLKFDVVRMGIDDKLPAVDAIAAELGLEREQICFIGDDLWTCKQFRRSAWASRWRTPPRKCGRRRSTRRAFAAARGQSASSWK